MRKRLRPHRIYMRPCSYSRRVECAARATRSSFPGSDWSTRRVIMSEKTKITSAQIRAARGLLNWSARELSERSGVSQSSIHRAERAEGRPSMHEHSLAAIKAGLERYGVEFLDDSGVRLGLEQGAGAQTVDPSSKNFSVESRARWMSSGHS